MGPGASAHRRVRTGDRRNSGRRGSPYTEQPIAARAAPSHRRGNVPPERPASADLRHACADCGHQFDIVQSFSDDSLTICPECEGRLRKQFSAVGVVFKGSGFYRTDSRPRTPASPAPPRPPKAGRATAELPRRLRAGVDRRFVLRELVAGWLRDRWIVVGWIVVQARKPRFRRHPQPREVRLGGGRDLRHTVWSPDNPSAPGAVAEIGVIGGSGFYSFLTDARVQRGDPFGPPSDPVVVGEVEGRRVAFLARHGRGTGSRRTG